MKGKQYNMYNIVVSLLVGLIILLVFNKIIRNTPSTDNIEGFNTNEKYNKYDETVLKDEATIEDGMWKTKNLAQCKEKCNNDKKCIGFSRDKIDDKIKGGCYPIKEKIGDCHSSRKGEKNERQYAINYDSYIKSSYKDDALISKCLNNKHMNNYIHINSYLHPEHYLTISDNILYFLEHQDKGIDFHKYSTFQIVKGLEGSGTVSFIVKDNFNENYYLSANSTSNYLELVPIDESTSSTNVRADASFEVLNGMADIYKVSFRKYNLANNQPELYLILNEKQKPRIELNIKENIETRTQKEAATFNLINQETNENMTDTKLNKDEVIKERLKNHNNQNNIVEKNTRLSEQFKPSKTNTNTKENFSTNTVTLIDNNNNRLIIPAYYEVVSAKKLKDLIIKLNKKYQDNKVSGDADKKFDENSINEVLLSNPDEISCKIYNYDFTTNKNSVDTQEKTIFNKVNKINYFNYNSETTNSNNFIIK